jgi:hypothetical protein
MPQDIDPKKFIEAGFDVVKIAEREWADYNTGTIMDDLEKAATGYAFTEGMQNRYWYSRNVKEDIVQTTHSDEIEHNRDTYNLIRDYYLQWAGMIKAGIPIYRCDPVDVDNSKEKETARIVNGLHKYHYKYVWNFDTSAYSKLLPALFKGATAYVYYYKGIPDNFKAPGKKPKTVLKEMILPVFSVTPIGDYQTSLSECAGVIVEICLPVRQIMEMFPDQADEILAHVIQDDTDHCDKLTRQATYLSQYGIEPRKPSRGVCIQDRELIWHVKYHRAVPGLWDNGKRWLILDDKTWEGELDGGLIPVEVVLAGEKENGRLPVSLAFEGVSSQIIVNDLMLALRKKAYRDANPDQFMFEDTIIDPKTKKYANGVELGDGQTRTIRPNRELTAQGIRPDQQKPWSENGTGSGIAFDVMGLSKNLLQSTMHVNAELAYDAPQGTPAELLKTQFTIGEKKLGPSQTIIESCLFRCWTLASELMQFAMTPNDTFVLVDAGHADTIVWKKENITEGLNHTFTSRIGVPTTAEARIKLIGMISQVFPQYGQSFDTEDIRVISDLSGYGIESGADPEIALAEEENRAIQNNEIEKISDKSGVAEWEIKRLRVSAEQNQKLHMKVLSKLKIGKIWNTLTGEQKEAVNQHYAQHASMNWLIENKQVGMFGMIPRAEFDILMWTSRGVEIPPEAQQFMKTTGSTYREAMAVMTPLPPTDKDGKPLPQEPSPAPGDPMTEVTTEPTTQI